MYRPTCISFQNCMFHVGEMYSRHIWHSLDNCRSSLYMNRQKKTANQLTTNCTRNISWFWRYGSHQECGGRLSDTFMRRRENWMIPNPLKHLLWRVLSARILELRLCVELFDGVYLFRNEAALGRGIAFLIRENDGNQKVKYAQLWFLNPNFF